MQSTCIQWTNDLSGSLGLQRTVVLLKLLFSAAILGPAHFVKKEGPRVLLRRFFSHFPFLWCPPILLFLPLNIADPLSLLGNAGSCYQKSNSLSSFIPFTVSSTVNKDQSQCECNCEVPHLQLRGVLSIKTHWKTFSLGPRLIWAGAGMGGGAGWVRIDDYFIQYDLLFGFLFQKCTSGTLSWPSFCSFNLGFGGLD